MSAIDVNSVQRTMHALLAREGRDVIYRDTPSGADLSVTAAAAASPTGLLPALVAAGEVVWREATGKGFALDIVRDRTALLGYRLDAIGDGTFTTVMLATMEATAQVARPDAIVVNDLNALWAAATDRIERGMRDEDAARGERTGRGERTEHSMPGEGSGRGSDSVSGERGGGSVSDDTGAPPAPRRTTGAAP